KVIDELSMADAAFLMHEFERVDCGVETSIDIECQDCLSEQAVELPFDREFFLPTKAPSSPKSTSIAGVKPPLASPGSPTEGAG
ncbi:hypothetical protein ACSTLN_23735, partial [Vibrio parahaemolyticus]